MFSKRQASWPRFNEDKQVEQCSVKDKQVNKGSVKDKQVVQGSLKDTLKVIK